MFASRKRNDEHYAVIASTPRSGTTYMRAVLDRCGIRTGHENVFKSSGAKARPPEWLTVEVSGFAGLHAFTNDGPVLHQTRHPLKVISSLAALGILRTRDPSEIAGWYLRVHGNNTRAADFTYRIEDLDLDLLLMVCDVLGQTPVDPEQALAAIPTDLNSRPKTMLSPADLGKHERAVSQLIDDYLQR